MKLCKRQMAETISRSLFVVWLAFFLAGCLSASYPTTTMCNSKTGKECQRACSSMECTDPTGWRCFSGGNDWEWFERMGDNSYVKILGSKQQGTFLMTKQGGRMYLIMEGRPVPIIPGRDGGPTIAKPPWGRWFSPITFRILEEEGFECTETIDEVWIPKDTKEKATRDSP